MKYTKYTYIRWLAMSKRHGCEYDLVLMPHPIYSTETNHNLSLQLQVGGTFHEDCGVPYT